MKARNKILISLGVAALLGCGSAWYFFTAKPAEREARTQAWERVAAKSLEFMGIENGWTRDVEGRMNEDIVKEKLIKILQTIESGGRSTWKNGRNVDEETTKMLEQILK